MRNASRTLLIVSVALLLVYGVVMLYSTTYVAWGESYLKRQLVWIGLGSMGAVAIVRWVDYRVLGQYAGWLLLGAGAVLGYLAVANVLFKLAGRMPGISREVVAALPLVGITKGSARWLRFAGFTVQPSEFAKLVIMIFLANYFARSARHMQSFWRGFLKPLGAVGIVCVLILLGGDLSSTAVTGTVVLGIAFVGGMRLRYLLLVSAAGLALAMVAITTDSERRSRLTSFRDPEQVQENDGYQLWHSKLALGSGNWRGLGFTNSRMKHFYLPEAHTDFIAAIIGEELGFLGVLALVLLYAMLTVSALWIAWLTQDREGTLLAAGIGIALGFQAFVNISVVSGFCPTTGVTAPLVSYGGSSIIASLLAVGLLLNILRVDQLAAATGELGPPGG